MRIGLTRAATIVDVAECAGVSIKSVSRVINLERNVSQSLRARVLEAAAKLDYQPNAAARALAGGRTFLLGLAFGNVSPNYSVGLQTAVAERIVGTPYRMALIPLDSVASPADEIRHVVRASGFDGLILTPPISDDAEVRRVLDELNVLFACVGPNNGDCSSTYSNNEDTRATRELIGYLAGLGHRDIAIIRGNSSHASAAARVEGFKRGLSEQGLIYRNEFDEPGLYSVDSGYEAASRLLGLLRPPSAIFACNDDMAAGTLLAARDRGLDVPAQLSIAGFDDSAIASIVTPRLTTIHQPIRQMAGDAADHLLCLIRGDPVSEGAPVRFHLVRGASAGPI